MTPDFRLLTTLIIDDIGLSSVIACSWDAMRRNQANNPFDCEFDMISVISLPAVVAIFDLFWLSLSFMHSWLSVNQGSVGSREQQLAQSVSV
jgi:hypothetical protein